MQVDESGNVTSFHNMGSNVQNPHDPAGLNHAQQAVAIRFLMVERQESPEDAELQEEAEAAEARLAELWDDNEWKFVNALRGQLEFRKAMYTLGFRAAPNTAMQKWCEEKEKAAAAAGCQTHSRS